ncbi:DUF6468 domain-containing protein [Devosia sp. FJ2-5-3]|uniref:DUF6468 domain-containing protein n=1 Tax=Devosia sp. FJ2-5-3 TaxID=2976680 RepID=UPI0023D82F06|nr:DUF6468 domain-containing protein [Devosia sp. FJ2-5-3]WEJ59982.1 DUF6468 domain-containing protein [Devosia sp. FJ2-5-3]
MGLSLGLFIEGAVALLLALTLGYCIVLNRRLTLLHADRDALRLMVGDLVTATSLANQAIKELKTTAVEADLSLTSRLEEAERFGIQLANHINSGNALMQRIAKITAAGRRTPAPVAGLDLLPGAPAAAPAHGTNKVRAALEQLSTRVHNRGVAA